MKLQAIFLFILFCMGSNAFAQKQDSSAKQKIEIESKGEAEIRKQVKKEQLSQPPVLLNMPQSASNQKSTTKTNRKKSCSYKKCRKN